MAASLTEALGSRETKVPATRPAHLLGAGPGLCSLSLVFTMTRGLGRRRKGHIGRPGEGSRETGRVDNRASWPASRDACESMVTTFK